MLRVAEQVRGCLAIPGWNAKRSKTRAHQSALTANSAPDRPLSEWQRLASAQPMMPTDGMARTLHHRLGGNLNGTRTLFGSDNQIVASSRIINPSVSFRVMVARVPDPRVTGGRSRDLGLLLGNHSN